MHCPIYSCKDSYQHAPTIRAFVAKNLNAISIAPYFRARTATNIATTIRAFGTKNLDAKKLNRVLIGEYVD